MEAYRQEIIIGAVLIYFVFCVLTGIWAMRRTHSSSDFFVAGRGLGPIVVSLALFSSTLSGLALWVDQVWCIPPASVRSG